MNQKEIIIYISLKFGSITIDLSSFWMAFAPFYGSAKNHHQLSICVGWRTKTMHLICLCYICCFAEVQNPLPFSFSYIIQLHRVFNCSRLVFSLQQLTFRWCAGVKTRIIIITVIATVLTHQASINYVCLCVWYKRRLKSPQDIQK